MGVVYVPMRDGTSVYGWVAEELVDTRPPGLRGGITVLRENGQMVQVDLLDAEHVAQADPTDKLRAVLAGLEMWS
jgi:hypothetical protein